MFCDMVKKKKVYEVYFRLCTKIRDFRNSYSCMAQSVTVNLVHSIHRGGQFFRVCLFEIEGLKEYF